MRTLFSNATIITQNESRDVIDKGFIIVENGIISNIGNGSPCNIKFDEEIDLNNKWILPGFVNAHVHLGESVYFPFISEKVSLSEYLDKTEKIYASSENIGLKRDVICRYSLYQLILNGVTTIGGGRVSGTAKSVQMPNTSGYMLMDSNKLGHFSKDIFEKFTQTYSKEESEITRHAIFIHSLSRVGDEELSVVKKLKEEIDDLIVMLHIDETKYECEAVANKWGRGSIDVLCDYGLLNKSTFLVHGNHLSLEDLNKIAEANATICHCLTSNITVADKTLDLKEVVRLGINTVVATDGPISGTGFNILNEIRKVYQYQNRFCEQESITPQQCLDMVTINAAKSIGQSAVSGSIEVGKMGNFSIFEQPFVLGTHEIIEFLVRYELSEVFGVVLQGKKVVWNKNILLKDWHNVRDDFSQLISSIDS